MGKELYWKVHTPNFLSDILKNLSPNGLGMITTPMNIFRNLLVQVSQRASQLNDPELNALMVRLTLYEISDPKSKDYNYKLIDKMIYGNKQEQAKENLSKISLKLPIKRGVK